MASQPNPPPKIDPATARKAGKALLTVVGGGVALALGLSIPSDESGRKVETSIGDDSHLVVKHISGKQYLNAYLDVVKVGTACDGITTYNGKPIKLGDKFTEEQCAAMLEAEIVKHAEGVMKCTPGLALSSDPKVEAVREGPRYAAVSGAYNFGVGAYCTSSAHNLFNAGKYAAGCDALTKYNRGTFGKPYAGGECYKKKTGGWSCVVKGLDIRRKREHKVCVGGLGAL